MPAHLRPLSLLLPLLLAAPLAAQAPQRPKPEEIARSVDSLAARVVSSRVSPALGVAVVMEGRKIFQKSYGMADASLRIPANDRTLWYLASTSKSYTGFGISLLVHQGVLDLATPIATLLPDVRWPEGVDPSQLTLAHFLSHTHHINDNAVVQSAAFTGAIPERQWPTLIRFATPAGNDDLVYSNFGYNVAAMVIDRLRPEGWRRFLDSAVYRPAGMKETYTRVSGLDARRIAKPHGFGPAGGFVTRKFEKADATMNSAGGHLATLNDLARWMIVQMDSGRIGGKQVYPVEAVALSHRLLAKHTVERSERFAFFDREGWGAGWDLGSYQGEPMVSRFGGYSSIRSHLSMLPARRVGVVAQVNGPGASMATDIVAALVYDLEAGRADARSTASARLDSLIAQQPAGRQGAAASDSTRRERQRPLRRPLADFAGSYANEAFGTISFTPDGEALRFHWGVLDGPVEVLNAERDMLRIEVAGSGTPVAFRFEGLGVARSVEVMGVSFQRQ
jgi:CubicO group peptidase (beta-lactamase class C family)